MSRRRYLSTEISRDKVVNRLAVQYGDFAALLYTWLIPHASDDGTVTADAEELLYIVLPGRRDKTIDDMDNAIAAMLELGLLERYDGERLSFPYESFYRYQTYIREDNRRKQETNVRLLNEERETPQNADDHNTTPDISDQQRDMAHTAASFSPSFSFSPSEDEARARALRPLLEFGVSETAFTRSLESFPDIPLAEWPAEVDSFVAYHTGDRKKPPKNRDRAWTNWLVKSRQFRRERVASNGHGPPDRPLPAYVVNRLDDMPMRKDVRDGF